MQELGVFGGLIPEQELLNYIVRALTGNKYVVKNNPWEKIGRDFGIRAKKKNVLSLVPYFAHSRGGKRPDGVKAINDILAWAAHKMSCVHPAVRAKVIEYYMPLACEKINALSEDEINRQMLAAALGDAFREAVRDALALENTPGSVDEAVRILRDKYGAKKVCNRVRKERAISEGRLVLIAKYL